MVGMFSKYPSSEQAIKDRTDCVGLIILRRPQPKFRYKRKSPVLCLKTGGMNVKLILF